MRPLYLIAAPLALAACGSEGAAPVADENAVSDSEADALAEPEKIARLPDFPLLAPGEPRMLALVGGTFEVRDDCAWLATDGAASSDLILWPRGMMLMRDDEGYYVQLEGRRLREGERFRSGGGSIPLDGRDDIYLPPQCAAENGVVVYSPYSDDPTADRAPEEPPPPPAGA